MAKDVCFVELEHPAILVLLVDRERSKPTATCEAHASAPPNLKLITLAGATALIEIEGVDKERLARRIKHATEGSLDFTGRIHTLHVEYSEIRIAENVVDFEVNRQEPLLPGQETFLETELLVESGQFCFGACETP